MVFGLVGHHWLLLLCVNTYDMKVQSLHILYKVTRRVKVRNSKSVTKGKEGRLWLPQLTLWPFFMLNHFAGHSQLELLWMLGRQWLSSSVISSLLATNLSVCLKSCMTLESSIHGVRHVITIFEGPPPNSINVLDILQECVYV